MIALLCFVQTILASPFKSKMRPEAENALLRRSSGRRRERLEDTGDLFRLTSHGVYGHARRVVSRHPYEGAPPHADMSETGEGNMCGADPVSCLRRIGEYALAVRFGLILVAVVFDGHGGIRKLDSRYVNHNPPDKELLSHALERVWGVARSVARQRNGADARHYLLFAFERH